MENKMEANYNVAERLKFFLLGKSHGALSKWVKSMGITEVIVWLMNL